MYSLLLVFFLWIKENKNRFAILGKSKSELPSENNQLIIIRWQKPKSKFYFNSTPHPLIFVVPLSWTVSDSGAGPARKSAYDVAEIKSSQSVQMSCSFNWILYN